MTVREPWIDHRYRAWIRNRWTCFREGHAWHYPELFGPDQCQRCGKLVEW